MRPPLTAMACRSVGSASTLICGRLTPPTSPAPKEPFFLEESSVRSPSTSCWQQARLVSPMLFILAMDPLLRMFECATSRGILEPIPRNAVRMRTSLYADDAAIFASPDRSQLDATLKILEVFGSISGLKINPAKCVAYPIRCQQDTVQNCLAGFGGSVGSFPCKYLGLPLSFKKLRRIDLQPLLDKGAGRLSIWKGKLLNRTGRLDLINSVLTATITFFLTVFAPNGWFTKKFDKLRRNFLWNADEEAHGGKCLVNWRRICAPKSVGGLGIKDIHAFGRALRLRWPWYEWDDVDRPWKGTPVPCEQADLNLFAACTTISVGDGRNTSFWNQRWLQGQAPKEIAPDLFKLARSKRLSVCEALSNGAWMRGLRTINTPMLMDSFINLWWILQGTSLQPWPDSICWNLTANGVYSAKSVYHFQFLTRIPQPHLQRVWNIKAEGKIKFFTWTLLQNRLWTADRLLARNWDHNDACSYCDQTLETAMHLILECPFAKEVWLKASGSYPDAAQAASGATSILAWWSKVRSLKKKGNATDECTAAVYIAWHLWIERNNRVFKASSSSTSTVLLLARDAIGLLKEAGE